MSTKRKPMLVGTFAFRVTGEDKYRAFRLYVDNVGMTQTLANRIIKHTWDKKGRATALNGSVVVVEVR